MIALVAMKPVDDRTRMEISVFISFLLNNPQVSFEGDKIIFQKHREILEGDKFLPKGTGYSEGSLVRVKAEGGREIKPISAYR
jgi:hypothetical protein